MVRGAAGDFDHVAVERPLVARFARSCFAVSRKTVDPSGKKTSTSNSPLWSSRSGTRWSIPATAPASVKPSALAACASGASEALGAQSSFKSFPLLELKGRCDGIWTVAVSPWPSTHTAISPTTTGEKKGRANTTDSVHDHRGTGNAKEKNGSDEGPLRSARRNTKSMIVAPIKEACSE